MASGRQLALGFPVLLFRQLQLWQVLLSTSRNLSESQASGLPMMFADFLSSYENVLRRAFSDFPKYGKELCLLVQCVAQVSLVLSDTAKLTLDSSIPLRSLPEGSVNIRNSATEAMILHVSLKIAENPFPKEWLADLPHSLRHQEKTEMSRLVPYSDASGCSWWVLDKFQVASRRNRATNFEEWTDAMFGHAILGAEIIQAGMTVLMGLSRRNFDVELSFVRALFLLSKAAQVSSE